MNKKGALSIETIIIIILALIVLVIIAAAFSGGMTELWKKIRGVQEVSTFTNKDLAIQSCNVACSLKQEDSFCNRPINVEEAGVPKTYNNCAQLLGKPCEGLTKPNC